MVENLTETIGDSKLVTDSIKGLREEWTAPLLPETEPRPSDEELAKRREKLGKDALENLEKTSV